VRRWVLAAALLVSAPAASAQDVLDDVEWDAILKATAPRVEEQQARASAAAAAEEKPRGKRARAKEQAEIDKAAASVESLAAAGAEPAPAAASEGDKPEKPGKRGKRTKEKAAAAEVAPAAGARAEAASARKGEKSAAKDDAKGGKAGQSDEKGAGRGAKSAAAEKEKPLPPVKRGPNDRGVPANYIALKRYWHAPWDEDRRSKMAGMAPPLIIHPVHPVGANPTPYVLLPESTDGGFAEAQIEVASQAWDSWPGGPRVSQRLLNLIYHAAMHFDMFHVHLISGVRHDRGGSRHSHALAADIVLPGVTDEELATYFRAQGFCGVGIYTRAGFVHIDTRDTSYFWLDWSLPGRRNRQQQILGDQAKAADEAAMARGQGQFVNPPKLQKALEARLRKRKVKASKAAAQQANQEGS
jgi:Peptidase M15